MFSVLCRARNIAQLGTTLPPSFLFCAAFCLGIGDAGVVDGFQSLYEHLLGKGYVVEGDGTFLEVTLCHVVVDNPIYECSDVLFGIFRQRP